VRCAHRQVDSTKYQARAEAGPFSVTAHQVSLSSRWLEQKDLDQFFPVEILQRGKVCGETDWKRWQHWAEPAQHFCTIKREHPSGLGEL